MLYSFEHEQVALAFGEALKDLHSFPKSGTAVQEMIFTSRENKTWTMDLGVFLAGEKCIWRLGRDDQEGIDRKSPEGVWGKVRLHSTARKRRITSVGMACQAEGKSEIESRQFAINQMNVVDPGPQLIRVMNATNHFGITLCPPELRKRFQDFEITPHMLCDHNSQAQFRPGPG